MDRSSSGAPGALGPRHDSSSRVQKSESAADKMAALKARVAAAIGTSKAKGGLNVGLHPALEDLSSWKPSGGNKESGKAAQQQRSQADGRPAGPGSSTGRPAPRIGDGQSNPYFDESASSQGAGSKQRVPRQLAFNQKGKYIQQANALRQQAALDAARKRIENTTRKIGLDEDRALEEKFVIAEPPEIEWWDQGLINGGTYDNINDPTSLKIDSPDSLITEYVQHPVALEAPQDRQAPAPKAMFLTSKEQAKIRRQRRMADLKEMQAKIRLGLVPAPPPKVKKGNLMRVLGDVAVKDPTAVEARVNREIADRKQKHVEANDERKLTKDQKHEKLAANQQKDAEKGIRILVLKIDSLANGRHRFKISISAEQYALTGVCIMHPKFNLVVVEGGDHSIKQYKKLMLNRIDWTENAPSRDRGDGKEGSVRKWLLAENERGELKDMSLNECKLIFEGEEQARAFRKWGSKVCETDGEARQLLARSKMDNFWTLAKSFV